LRDGSSKPQRARKRFGQHFLTDPALVDRIIQAVNPKTGDQIVEIGPGRGALSLPLLASGASLHLIEIDRDLAYDLKKHIGGYETAKLHIADALKIDFAALCGGHPFRLVGNLPYNISTPLLFHLLQWAELIRDMHFMLQREVVERLAASPGRKAWGRLSIMCQLHCEVTPLFPVPPEAFSPRPRVFSSVVRLQPHRLPPVQIESMEAFQEVVRQAFSMRRKTLRNSLRGLLDASAIESAGIDPGLRPEALGLEEFAALSRLLEREPKSK
jgi:16S rRNA (adenine1518-N6/adenine1519-N6)-dimethyltransferase